LRSSADFVPTISRARLSDAPIHIEQAQVNSTDFR
jgi:hypothetical protein